MRIFFGTADWDKSAALQTYVDKGVIESLELFNEDEYHDMLDEVKAIFTE